MRTTLFRQFPPFCECPSIGAMTLKVTTVFIDHLRGKPVILFAGREGRRGGHGTDKLTIPPTPLDRMTRSLPSPFSPSQTG